MIEQIKEVPNVLNKRELQIGYETMFDKKQARKLIRDRFSEVIEPLELNQEDKQLCCDILGIVALRTKRTSVSAIFEMLNEKLNIEESIDNIMKCIIELYNVDLLNGEVDSKNRLYIDGKFTLGEKDLELLDQYQYKIPMLVKPLPLNQRNNNRGNGYYLNGTDSLILNVHHEWDIDHKVLERLNNISYSINLSLMKNIRNSWKNMGKSESDKTNKDTMDNFERFEKGIFNVSSILLNNGNKFYFTHKYDKRGRVYCCGYHLNTQGNSYSKAQLEFANKQLISDSINFF